MSSDLSTEAGLQRAYLRARQSPAFVASLVALWERTFDGNFAAAAGTDRQTIIALGLCLRPRVDHWSVDIEEIASDVGIDQIKLSSLLRQAYSVETLAGAPSVNPVVDGRLLAARDREDPESIG
jgi:hypothetical protein